MNDPNRLGEALAFAEHPIGESPPPEWQPLTAHLEEASLRARVEQVRTQLHSPDGTLAEPRVAAATEQFGLVAKLVAAHICAAALGFSLETTTRQIWWRRPPGEFLQLSFARTNHPRNPLQHGAIPQLIDSIQQLYGVSAQVLWGNIGSAANSTLNLLRSARPDLVQPAQHAADDLLRDPRIDGGTLRSGPGFRRHSCCLIYRAGIGMCGDCVLRS